MSLQGNDFTDRGLAYVAALENLEEIYLCAYNKQGPDRISDAGLAHLEGMKSLEELGLQNTLVSDAGLQHFLALPGLERVVLNGTRVTPAGVKALQQARPDLGSICVPGSLALPAIPSGSASLPLRQVSRASTVTGRREPRMKNLT